MMPKKIHDLYDQLFDEISRINVAPVPQSFSRAMRIVNPNVRPRVVPVSSKAGILEELEKNKEITKEELFDYMKKSGEVRRFQMRMFEQVAKKLGFME